MFGKCFPRASTYLVFEYRRLNLQIQKVAEFSPRLGMGEHATVNELCVPEELPSGQAPLSVRSRAPDTLGFFLSPCSLLTFTARQVVQGGRGETEF